MLNVGQQLSAEALSKATQKHCSVFFTVLLHTQKPGSLESGRHNLSSILPVSKGNAILENK